MGQLVHVGLCLRLTELLVPRQVMAIPGEDERIVWGEDVSEHEAGPLEPAEMIKRVELELFAFPLAKPEVVRGHRGQGRRLIEGRGELGRPSILQGDVGQWTSGRRPPPGTDVDVPVSERLRHSAQLMVPHELEQRDQRSGVPAEAASQWVEVVHVQRGGQ